MFAKTASLAASALLLSLLIPPWRRRLDHHVFRHYRNWREQLDDWNRFQTQEDFHNMLANVARGSLAALSSAD